MSRDYASSGRRKPQARNTRVKPSHKSLPGWLWLLSGILIGILANAVVDFSGKSQTPANDESPEVVKEQSSSQDDGGPKPRFDFYTLLKENEVIIPDESGEQGKSAPIVIAAEDDPGDKQNSDNLSSETSEEPELQPEQSGQREAENSPEREVYVLQAGSFRNASDADSVRANLLLLNMHANIEKVNIAPGETWHRVLVGPFTSKSELSNVQSVLSRNGIDSIQLKRRM